METLYVAQFNLSSAHQQVLSFTKGERFIPLTSKTNNKSWTMGVNLRGSYGYIPYTYIKEELVPKSEFVSLIEIALECVEKNCSGSYTKHQRDIIQELTTWRTLLLSPVHSPVDAKEAISSKEAGQRHSIVEMNRQRTLICDAHHSNSSIHVDPKEQTLITDIKPEEVKNACLGESEIVSALPNTPKHASQIVSSVPLDYRERILVNDQGENFPKKPDLKNAQTQCPDEGDAKKTKDLEPDKPNNVGTDQMVEDKSTSKELVEPRQNHVECLNCTKADVPVYLIPSLIENVRHETQLSHQNSKLAVAVVMNTLSEALPTMNELWKQLKNNLDRFEVIQEEADSMIFSEDRRKLRDIFRQLWCCKNDEQQRSWPVHEDEELIASLLQDLNTILMDADPKISKEAVQHDDYELVNLLVTYYQMEARRVLRVKMLQVFVTLCKLDVTVVAQLLQSVLPMELARDMQCTFDDTEKLQYSAYVLTIIFSTGQKPPNAIYEFIDSKFINFLFENVELSLRDGDEEISNDLLNVLLAFNLHFDSVESNPVFNTLKERQDVRMLTVKLIFYVNREVDPINILDLEMENPNSVLKFLVDFFAFSELAQLFYLNDIRVLLDIIVRQLTDYLPGEKKRFWYLQLVKNIVRNSNYEEHFHQQDGLQKCFSTILAQEDPCLREISLVKDILAEFPTWFSH